MTKYICKCGRVVAKSTSADNTGNRDTENCKGCPYLLPWGPTQWDATRHAMVTDVKGYECRMSPSLDYATYYQGGGEDKCVLHIYSLDYDFLDRVTAWAAKQFPDKEISCSFDRSKIRATEFIGGLYGMSVYPMQNKKGMAAKAALIERFFGPDGHRLDTTPEEEKAIVLAAIEAGKAKVKTQERKKTMDYIISKHEATGRLYAYYKGSFWFWDSHVQRWLLSQFAEDLYQEYRKSVGDFTREDMLAETSAFYLLDDYEVSPNCIEALLQCNPKTAERENPTNAAEDAQQCALTASDAPTLPSPSANADAQQGVGDNPANPTHAAPVSPVDAGAATQSPSDAAPASLEVESELDVAMKGHSSEECQECGISSDKCRCKECLREGCRDYPGTAYCVIGNNVCPGRVMKETSIPGADGSTAFDYSGLDDQTVADLHLAEREYSSGKKMAEMGLRRMADAVAIAHDALCGSCDKLSQLKHGNRGENAFGTWCESIGIHRKAAERLLQVAKLMDSSTPREEKVLEELSPSLLYAAAKPSAPAELVQAVKDGEITTHKQYQEALAEIKARDAKIQELLEMSEGADRRADAADARAKKAEQERDAARDAQANLSAMANKFSKQRDAAEQRVEDAEHRAEEAERRARAAEEDAAGWKQAGLEMQELVDQRDERIRELESGITVEAAAVDQEEIERRANELSEPLLKIINQRDEQIKQMASGNTVAVQASVLEQYIESMKASLLGNARRAELACYDVGALDSLAQALREFADEIDGLFEEGEENEE